MLKIYYIKNLANKWTNFSLYLTYTLRPLLQELPTKINDIGYGRRVSLRLTFVIGRQTTRINRATDNRDARKSN